MEGGLNSNGVSKGFEAAGPLTVSLLKILAYFDIFNYPLTSGEIYNYCDHRNVSFLDVQTELQQLSRKRIIHNEGNFYFLGNDPQVVEKRMHANRLSEKFMKKARMYSRIIGSFPFVKAVCISGSLSKGYADNKADIDYFIITEPGRLWVARTMLVLFKKTFLFNSRKYFCVNYFIDSDNLEIPDKNIFTATEIVFLIPTYDHANYLRFLQANSWTEEHYPNLQARTAEGIVERKNQPLKKVLEKLMKGRAGEMLDSVCFRITLRHWKKKFSNFSESDFDLNMRSRRNVSKHHPHGFQGKVLAAYREKINALELRLGIRMEEKILTHI